MIELQRIGQLQIVLHVAMTVLHTHEIVIPRTSAGVMKNPEIRSVKSLSALARHVRQVRNLDTDSPVSRTSRPKLKAFGCETIRRQRNGSRSETASHRNGAFSIPGLVCCHCLGMEILNPRSESEARSLG